MNQEIIGSAGIFIRSYFENTVLHSATMGAAGEDFRVIWSLISGRLRCLRD